MLPLFSRVDVVVDAEGFRAEEGGAVSFVLGFEFAAVGGANAILAGWNAAGSRVGGTTGSVRGAFGWVACELSRGRACGGRRLMPVGSEASVWVPLVFPILFPILFPIVFPMGLMLFFMMRRGGPMGLMMGGRPRRTRGGRADLEGRGDEGERESGGSELESPLEVACRRYAAGEISREEFWRMREDLGPR